MVSNYIEDNCKYRLSKLVNVVYLINEDAVKDIRVDDGAAYIASISQTPMELGCYGIKLSESESLDERYKFTHTLTFSVNGYANKDNFDGKYYAIVKDEEGTYWLINPLFPCKVTYTYNLGYQEDHTDFTLSTVSNHPVLELKNFSAAKTSECKRYTLGGIDKLWLNESKLSAHDENHVKYTNDGGFKVVDFKKASGLLSETYNGTNISHSIRFTIEFNNYLSSWHYNLLEFIYNTYASVVKTKNGEYTLCGFNYGMQPTYNINADGTVQEINSIEVTLTDSHDNGGTLEFFDNIDYEYLSARTWEYTSKYGGYECVDEGVARYLLKSEYDALGNETGRYMAYSGHNADFADMNIVGTFDEDAKFKNPECVGMGCRLNASIPSEVVFNTIGCKTYYINSDSPWSATSSSSNITISPTSGNSNVGYNFKICNTLEPTSTPRTSTITIEYCDTATTFNAKVVEGNSCLPQGSTYNISANAQTLTIPTKCCVESVRETVGVGSIINIYSNYITVQVPENNTGFYRTITLLVIYCDGSSGNIIINQSDVFEAWLDEYSSCVGYDKYERQYKYTGHTSSSITSRTDEYRDILVEVNSEDCGYVEPIYRWFDTEDYICSGVAKYHVAKQQVSNDNGSTWEDVIPITTGTGSIWEAQSEDCGYIPPQYRTSTGASYCVGYNRYADVTTEVSYDGGETWSEYDVESVLFDIDSTFCGVLYRWIPSGETCVGYDKYVLAVKQKSYNNGLSWSDVVPLTTSATTLIEHNSEDCGFQPYQERWVETDDTICLDLFKFASDFVTGTSYSAQCNYNDVLTSADTRNATQPLTAMTQVTIGNCVKEIDAYSFGGDHFDSGRPAISLSSVTISNSVDKIRDLAFMNCYNLSSVNFGESVKIIGGEAFNGCGFTDITIPNSVTSIDYGGFNDCTGLTSVTINSSNIEINENAFAYSNVKRVNSNVDDVYNVPSGVKRIEKESFADSLLFYRGGNQHLKTLNIASGTRGIGVGTNPSEDGNPFAWCYNLSSIYVDSNNPYYNSNGNCNAIIETSTNKLVCGCKNTTIPNSVTTIGSEAFAGSTGLTHITIPNGVTSIGSQAFAYCKSLTSVEIPDSVTTIGWGAFYYCTNMTHLKIGSGVTSIEDNTFERCSGLTSVDIPDSVRSLKGNTFLNCRNLTSVNIGSGITEFGWPADFAGCSSLQSVTLHAVIPPTPVVDTYPFPDGCTLYVPAESVETYRNWVVYSGHADKIQPIP